MKRLLYLVAALSLVSFQASAQSPDVLAKYVQNKSHIREGGVDVFKYEGVDYIVAVSPVQVVTAKGAKTEAQCRTVGSSKAKRDMLSFVQGSSISSYTELTFSETSTEGPEGRRVDASQTYVEVIKEQVAGSINQTVPLCGWYSADGSLYYFALFKPVQ